LIICGFLASAWNEHNDFETTSEKLVRQLGTSIVLNLGKLNTSCMANARIDSVSIDSDWLLAKKGTATLYISGKDGAAVAISYKAETSNGKVFLQPQDTSAAPLSVIQFGLKGCS
jgi:hypothetical protein